MTGEDLIEANKDLLIDARVSRVGNLPCVIGKCSVSGKELAVFWRGDVHVDVRLEATRHRGVMGTIKQTLRDHQPGKEFATVYDDRLADKLRKGGLTAYRRADGSVTGIKPEGVSP